ncbi:hypothetical protein Aoki45_14180 [Algoriphagus sp. oki45]|uniref:DinB family protein n=1 Tax=Algoriphagus sp. oki45 TaxID=3067294 RepID=UPI0027F3E6BD|nr:hypothetical protein Aoki45_14180 [Algoriphagus sp. oki45]
MDIASLKTLLWNQFGASIDMLIQAIDDSPDGYFQQNPRFFYIAFHSAIFLDYYLTIPPEDFSPLLSLTQKSPENRPKEAIDDCIPDRIYSKKELLAYLRQSRAKAQTLIDSLTEEKLKLRFTEGEEEGDMDYPLLEILLYNLRHTQHHTAQLNLLIRQDMDLHLKWSFRVGDLE